VQVQLRPQRLPESSEERESPAPDVSPRLQRIVEDLEGIFLAEGFLHLATEDLAARLHCSKRTLYQLASSREALFELVIERFLARIREEGEIAARAASDWVAAATDYLNVAVTLTRRAGPQFVNDLARFPAGHRRLMSHQRERIAGLERIVEGGVAAGAFRDVHPKLVAEVLLLAVARMADPAFLFSVDLSMSQAFGELYKIFSYGIIQVPSEQREEDSSRRTRPTAKPARRGGKQTEQRGARHRVSGGRAGGR